MLSALDSLKSSIKSSKWDISVKSYALKIKIIYKKKLNYNKKTEERSYQYQYYQTILNFSNFYTVLPW